MSEWKGQTALVTGASYGIGEAFARRLAADGADLVLAARSADRLEILARGLRSRHGVQVAVVEADLARPAAPEELFQETERRGLQVNLLVNNAGFGAVGEFFRLPLERQLEMIQVNVTALAALSHLYLQPMIERRRGAIVQVASTAAFQAVPYFAVYAATKAFVLHFSEALWAECREHGVRVLALCPGPTATHFQEVAGTSRRRSPEKMQTPEEVVEVGLRALARGRSHVVSGFGNLMQTEIERFVPRDVITRVAARLFRPFASDAQ
jgi:short-subunit dehydrogenase